MCIRDSVRVMSPMLGLVCFAVVCISGLVQGNSFASVVRGSLAALVAGAVAGVLAATVVRVVVTEQFNRQHPDEEVVGSPEAPSAAPAQGADVGEPPAQRSNRRSPESATAGK